MFWNILVLNQHIILMKIQFQSIDVHWSMVKKACFDALGLGVIFMILSVNLKWYLSSAAIGAKFLWSMRSMQISLQLCKHVAGSGTISWWHDIHPTRMGPSGLQSQTLHEAGMGLHCVRQHAEVCVVCATCGVSLAPKRRLHEHEQSAQELPQISY